MSINELVCHHCGCISVPVLAPAGPHLKASCGECGAYIKFVSQGGEPKLFFGKYKDKTIAEIQAEDPDYLRWLLTQDWLKPKLRRDIEQVRGA